MRAYPVLLLAVTALGASRPADSPVTCRYRVSYRGEVTRIQVAQQTFLHQTEYPSHVVLPVIPR